MERAAGGETTKPRTPHGVRGFRNPVVRLLATVALQKIHRVDGNCVAADGVGVVLHGDLLKSSRKYDPQELESDPSPALGSYYITGLTRMSFPNM